MHWYSQLKRKDTQMQTEDFEARWHQLAAEVITGMKEWRQQHPKATFREIETALDERLARVRARMLQDLALASRAAEWHNQSEAERPLCPDCGIPLQPRGSNDRELTTDYDQAIALKRSYGVCPRCQRGLFPPR